MTIEAVISQTPIRRPWWPGAAYYMFMFIGEAVIIDFPF